MEKVHAESKLGIIAGAGILPTQLIRFCQKTNRPFFVLALKNHADATLLPADCDIEWIRIGAVGKSFKLMKKHNVKDIVMIGSVRRPSILELLPDRRALQLLTRVGLNKKGDDGLLRDVIREIEKEGFAVRGIHELMPELLAPAGIFTYKKPDVIDVEDIARGCYVAKLLGLADVGQSVIVQQGLVLSVEGIEGTKALIERTKSLRRKGKGGVLVKTIKPMQEARADMPTIGVETVQSVYDAGLKGIAVESGKVLVTDVDAVTTLADKLGIFIIGIEPNKLIPPAFHEQIKCLTGHVKKNDTKTKKSIQQRNKK